MSRKE
jgi:hypothetical protein